MRKYSVLLVLALSVSPMADVAFAGKGKPEINVRNFTYKTLCDQTEVYAQYADVLVAEGLGHLVPGLTGNSNLPQVSMNDDEAGLEVEENEDEFEVNSKDTESVHLLPLPRESNQPFSSREEGTKALNEALLTHFIRGKKMRMKKTLAVNMVPCLWDGGCVTMAAVTGLGGPFGIATAFGRLIATAKEGIRDLVIGGRDILSSDDDPLEELEGKYVERKRFLNKSQQEAIENMFTAARAGANGLNKALEELPSLLNIPIHSKLPSADFEDAIDELAGGYITADGVDLANSLKNFCAAHLARFQDTKGVNPVAKHIIALQGPAGLGKSEIAKGLARILGLNPVEASMAGGVEGFFGSKKEPGSFFKAVTNQDGEPQLNCVVILEEVDRLANAKADAVGPLLRLLDPQAGEILLEGAGKFDWSHVAIIALMNHDVKSHEINDRWEVLKLIGVEKGHKDDVLEHGILPKFLDSKVPGLKLKADDLPQDKLKEILAIEATGYRQQEAKLRDLCSETRRAKLLKKKEAEVKPNGHAAIKPGNGFVDNNDTMLIGY